MENQEVDPFCEPPDFDEPNFDDEPPFSAPAAPAPAAPAQNPAALAARLGWTLEPATEAEALKIGAALGLRADDVMWPLILLQLRTVSTFSAVPAEVQKVIQATADETQKAARAEIEKIASETARTTKKEIFRVLAANADTKSWGDRLKICVSIVIAVAIIFAVGFAVGNTVPQADLFYNTAKLIYGEQNNG